MSPRKQPQLPPPTQKTEPDQVAEFLHLIRRHRVEAHNQHERIRKEADDVQKAYERTVEQLTHDRDQRLTDLREAAAKQADIVARCDLAAELDTPRDPPVLTRREEG